MLLFWISLAIATPPPLASRPIAKPGATGFDRLYIDPDAFASSLRPDDPVLSPRLAATTTVVLTPDPKAIAAAGLTLETIQQAVVGWTDTSDVRLSTQGDALIWSASAPHALTGVVADHTMDQLGTLRIFPPSWSRRPVPSIPVLAELRVVNDTLVRVDVAIADTRIGALLPGKTGTLHVVREGTYAVTLITPDGFEHPRSLETVRPALAPAATQ